MAWIARLVLGFVLLLLLFSFPPPLASWNQISAVAAAASTGCSLPQNSSTYHPEGGVFTQVWDGDGDVDIHDFWFMSHAFCFWKRNCEIG
jgi:hypothetical protein